MATQIPPPSPAPDVGEGDPPRDPTSTPEPEDPMEGSDDYKMPPSMPPEKIRDPRRPGA
jgi:hypothetical protein